MENKEYFVSLSNDLGSICTPARNRGELTQDVLRDLRVLRDAVRFCRLAKSGRCALDPFH